MSFPLFLTKLLIRSRIARVLPTARRLTDGGSAFLRYYSNRILTAPHAEVLQAGEQLQPRGVDSIDLASGSPSFDVVPSATTKLPADRRCWPEAWGLAELRRVVAENLHSEQGMSANPADEVLIAHGAAGAWSTVLETFVNRGDRVVLFDPASPLFTLFLRYRGARISWVPTWMEKGQTRFRMEALAKAFRRARMVVLATPNNPTGGVLAAEDLDQLTWWAQRRDVLIVNDTAFGAYLYDGSPQSVGTLPRAQKRTITIGSVSKSYALASARVGWLAGCRHLVRPCALAGSLQIPFVPTVCQQIALCALREAGDSLQKMQKDFQSRRQYAFDRLLAADMKPDWPSGAFFFWIPVGEFGMSGKEFAERLLLSKKVLVSPGELFGPSGAYYVRLSYAAEDGRLREGLSRLGDFVRDLREQRPGMALKAA